MVLVADIRMYILQQKRYGQKQAHLVVLLWPKTGTIWYILKQGIKGTS